MSKQVIQTQIERTKYKQPKKVVNTKTSEKLKTQLDKKENKSRSVNRTAEKVINNLLTVDTSNTTDTGAEISVKLVYTGRKVTQAVVRGGINKYRESKSLPNNKIKTTATTKTVKKNKISRTKGKDVQKVSNERKQNKDIQKVHIRTARQDEREIPKKIKRVTTESIRESKYRPKIKTMRKIEKNQVPIVNDKRHLPYVIKSKYRPKIVTQK